MLYLRSTESDGNIVPNWYSSGNRRFTGTVHFDRPHPLIEWVGDSGAKTPHSRAILGPPHSYHLHAFLGCQLSSCLTTQVL
jgi:hypothetical protein